MMKNVWLIATHEMHVSLRTRRVQAVGWLLLGLMVFCLFAGYTDYRKASRERAAAQRGMRQFFLSQGATNPHGAVHYGTFVFKPYSFLSLVDPGIEPFVGTSLRLEGHTQNQVQFAPSEQRSSLVRFGQLSFTVLWQVVLPLLLIFVAHGAIVTERQAGTLPLLLAQGVSMRQLVWGKVLGYSTLMGGVLILSGSGLLVLHGQSAPEPDADGLMRLGCLLTGYALYYGLIIALTVYVSARFATPGQVLALMVSGWFLVTILFPKLAMSLGDQSVRLPTQLQFDEQLTVAYRQGLNGHDPNDARVKRLQDSLLTRYNVKTIGQLPVNADGIIMQADETYHNRAYDQQYSHLQRLLAQQNQVTGQLALIDPLLALSHLSRGLAQTDIHQHLRFMQQAESYRRWLIQTLNDKMAYGGSKSGDYDWKVAPGYWEGLHDFAYDPPTIEGSLYPYRVELLAFLIWVLGTLGGIHGAIPRLRIV